MGAAPGLTAASDPTLALSRLERAENFPVALRVLPARYRTALRDAYSLARRIDEAGDDPAAGTDERLARLEVLRAEVQRRHGGSAIEAPFLALVEANRRDQTVSRYPTYDDLLGYCRLSADPIGRIVLAVFGVDDAETARRSDLVCTALQILEHCQDVAEDLRDNDRVYLPLEDLTQFGIDEHDLHDVVTPPRVKRLIAFEVNRAAALLDEGATVIDRLHGWARIAVAGYVAGGRATVDAIRAVDHDVLAGPPRPRKTRTARHLFRLLARRG